MAGTWQDYVAGALADKRWSDFQKTATSPAGYYDSNGNLVNPAAAAWTGSDPGTYRDASTTTSFQPTKPFYNYGGGQYTIRGDGGNGWLTFVDNGREVHVPLVEGSNGGVSADWSRVVNNDAHSQDRLANALIVAGLAGVGGAGLGLFEGGAAGTGLTSAELANAQASLGAEAFGSGTMGVPSASMGAGGAAGGAAFGGGGGGVAALDPAAAYAAEVGGTSATATGGGMDWASLLSNPQLISSGIGALVGSQSPRSLTTTSSTSLPAWLQPYAQDYAQRASDFAKTPAALYAGTLGAGTTDDQSASYGLARGIAQNAGANPLNSASQQGFLDTMSGKYLDPSSNPYLKSTYDAAAGRMADAYARGTAAQTNALFSNPGSFGGSAHQEMMGVNNRAFGDSLANLGNQIYGTNYTNERGNMVNAMNNATGVASNILGQQVQGYNTLNNAGTQQQQTNLTNNNLGYQDFLRQQQDPYNKLGAYQSIFQGMGTNTTQTQPGTSMANGLLGGALTGAGIYNLLK